MYRIHSHRLSTSPAARMNVSRITMAPKMPQNSTRYWYFSGTPKNAKITTNTNTLSMESDHSTKYPIKNSSARWLPNFHQISPLNASANPHQNTVHAADSRSDGSCVSRWNTN